ncbi:MAG: hypothetical protein JOZ38_08515 [Candidatus Eremiobacteraeota bacterium]|nr:hypothetical protein [Candidatus Eremiobacteraeota bacterium]
MLRYIAIIAALCSLAGPVFAQQPTGAWIGTLQSVTPKQITVSNSGKARYFVLDRSFDNVLDAHGQKTSLSALKTGDHVRVHYSNPSANFNGTHYVTEIEVLPANWSPLKINLVPSPTSSP